MNPKRGVVGLVLGLVLGVILGPYQSSSAATVNMYMRVQPPMETDAVGESNKACLSQRWHGSADQSGRALDWQNDCGENGDRWVHFRVRAYAPEALTDRTAQAYARQRAGFPCGSGSINYGRVAVTRNGTWMGSVTFQHFNVTNTTQFNVPFRAAGSNTLYRYTSVGVGKTADDSDTKSSSCWTGWHVHENNDAETGNWDWWNTDYYNSASTNCECHNVKDPGTATRRLHWVES